MTQLGENALMNEINGKVTSMKPYKSMAYVSFLLLLIAGCSEGPVGPVGPEGAPGNANVFSTNLLFSMSDATINGAVASVQYEVPGITPSVVDEGAVLLFFREQGTWTAMPYTFGIESPTLEAVDYTVTLGYGFDDGFLEIFYEASTDQAPLENQPDREIKTVIIDGFPLGKANTPDLTDYNAVKEWLGLRD